MSEEGWKIAIDNITASCRVHGWNSHGSAAIGNRTIDAARAICSSLHVTPTGEGNLMLSMANESIVIELDRLGQVISMCVDAKDANTWVDRSLAHAKETP